MVMEIVRGGLGTLNTQIMTHTIPGITEFAKIPAIFNAIFGMTMHFHQHRIKLIV
jgi:hypothetical protein